MCYRVRSLESHWRCVMYGRTYVRTMSWARLGFFCIIVVHMYEYLACTDVIVSNVTISQFVLYDLVHMYTYATFYYR